MTARRAAFAGIAVVALLILALLGDAAQGISIDVSGDSADEPILQAPAVALDAARAEMRGYGGLPRDAQLRSVSAESSSMVSSGFGGTAVPDAPQTPIVTAYSFTWQPRDDPAWGDHIIVRIGTTLDQRCAGSGTLPKRGGPALVPSTCPSYDTHYRLHATWVRRTWQPWPARAIAAAFRRWKAPLVPEPSSLTTDCKHVDMLALRRAVGTMENPVVPGGGPRHPQRWDEIVRFFHRPTSIVAHWKTPYPTVAVFPSRAPLPYTDAFIGSEGGLAIRFAHPSMSQHAWVPEWLGFESAVRDPVCPPRYLPEAAVRATASAPWRTIVDVLRARAEREATQRMAQVVSVRSRLVGADRRDPRHTTVTIETTTPHDGTWHAVYVVDERSPAIVSAHYERASIVVSGRERSTPKPC